MTGTEQPEKPVPDALDIPQPPANGTAQPTVAAALTGSELATRIEAEVAELKDQLLRALAEVENVRRRGQRELEEARKFAASEFARDLLAVADNLARALAAVPPAAREGGGELANLLAGVELTDRELAKSFERHGVKRVPAMGQKLDPNLHQAVAQLDHAEAEAGVVVQEFQPGYTMQGRLLRAAMVAVASGRKPDLESPGGAVGGKLDVQA
ncbi:MAG: nucleotide exchange factor GrpE [Alphaproteobacteria bacterium]|nr:nucleotide exchange factor GrpE [Alphaproteobacteria bacterium]